MGARRTHADVRMDTIVDERAGVLSLAKAERAAIDVLVERGRLEAGEASLLKDRLSAFADKIAGGFHVGADDPRDVRDRVRRIQRALIKEGGR